MRYLLVAALFAVTASSVFGAQLLVSSTPATGQFGATGMHRFTLSVLTEQPESFRGVDATFAGEMHQVNPFGLPTIFTDFSGVFPPDVDYFWTDEDSQFLVNSRSIEQIGATESDSLLKAAISGFADNRLPNPAPFAQIVAKNGAVRFDLSFDVGLPEPATFSGVLGVPEPTTCILAGLALVGAAARHRV